MTWALCTSNSTMGATNTTLHQPSLPGLAVASLPLGGSSGVLWGGVMFFIYNIWAFTPCLIVALVRSATHRTIVTEGATATTPHHHTIPPHQPTTPPHHHPSTTHDTAATIAQCGGFNVHCIPVPAGMKVVVLLWCPQQRAVMRQDISRHTFHHSLSLSQSQSLLTVLLSDLLNFIFSSPVNNLNVRNYFRLKCLFYTDF